MDVFRLVRFSWGLDVLKMATKASCFVFVLILSIECVSSADTTTTAKCGTETCTTGQVCETNDETQSCKKGVGSMCMNPTVTTTTTTASPTPSTGSPVPGTNGAAQTTTAPNGNGMASMSTPLPTVTPNSTAAGNATTGRKRRADVTATSECVLNADCVQEVSSPICRCMAGFNVNEIHFCQQDSGAESAKSSVMLASMMMLLLFFKM